MSDDSTGAPQDVEALAAKFHEIYQQEAKRQGDVRHKDAYADLPENIKEFDRVLARYVLSQQAASPVPPNAVEELASKVREWQAVCFEYMRAHENSKDELAAAFHRGATEAYKRVNEELRAALHAASGKEQPDDIGPSGSSAPACKDCGVRFHHTAEQCKEIQRVSKERSR